MWAAFTFCFCFETTASIWEDDDLWTHICVVCGSPVSSEATSSAFQSGWNQPLEKLSSQTAPCYCYVPSWSVTANVLLKEFTQQRSWVNNFTFHYSGDSSHAVFCVTESWVFGLISRTEQTLWLQIIWYTFSFQKGGSALYFFFFFFINVKEVSRVICSFCYSPEQTETKLRHSGLITFYTCVKSSCQRWPHTTFLQDITSLLGCFATFMTQDKWRFVLPSHPGRLQSRSYMCHSLYSV